MQCNILALVSYYFHASTAFWIFLCCYNVYKHIGAHKLQNIRYFTFVAYGIPLILAVVSIKNI